MSHGIRTLIRLWVVIAALCSRSLASSLQIHRDEEIPGKLNEGELRSLQQQQQRNSNYYRNYNSQQSSSNNNSRVHRRHNQRRRRFRRYTNLSDVFFCMFMALGWTVWMFSNFLKTDWSKYSKGSMLVKGNVRQVSVETYDSLGTGIPTYKAVIDYMVPKRKRTNGSSQHANDSSGTITSGSVRSSFDPFSSSTGGSAIGNPLDYSYNDASWTRGNISEEGDGVEEDEKIQIRKQFETQQQLQQGFANVELLVLPEEPTYSVLKEDFEKDNEIMHEKKYLEWWQTAWFRRLIMAITGTLVLASVAGAIQVVMRLRPERRMYGWIIVCIGVPLLLPLAIGIHYVLVWLRKVMSNDTQRSGVIISGAAKMTQDAVNNCSAFGNCEDILDTSACDDDVNRPTPIDGSTGFFIGGAGLDYTSVSNTTNVACTSVAETAGCYFIRFPKDQHPSRPDRRDRNRGRTLQESVTKSALALARERSLTDRMAFPSSPSQNQSEDADSLSSVSTLSSRNNNRSGSNISNLSS